jgi:Na+/proline symporter
MSDSENDLGVDLVAGCGCASAVSVFILAPLGVWLGLLLGSVGWAVVLGLCAVLLGPIGLTIILWWFIGRQRLRDRHDPPE